MTMPRNLVLVRHGQSEANVMQGAAKAEDHALFTEDMMSVPDRSWRLTTWGVQQAQTAGRWMQDELQGFDRHVVSPFIRTRETAAHLGITAAQWEENRVVRERSWGEIDSIPKAIFEVDYPTNYLLKRKDPLYWAPPAGESIANVAENRVRNLLNTLHRENSGQNVVVVTHGEFIWATRLVLERWSDEEFLARDKDPGHRIHNCTVLHYTRIDPVTGEESEKLRWVRRAWPMMDLDGHWDMEVGPWENFDRPYLSNGDLLALADSQAHRVSADEAALADLRASWPGGTR